MTLRVAFVPEDGLAPAASGVGHRDAYVVGRLILGHPDDDGYRGVGEPRQAFPLLVSGTARLQSTVPFRHLPDSHAEALRATREFLVRRVLDRVRQRLLRGESIEALTGEDMLLAEETGQLARAGEKRCSYQAPSPSGLVCQADASGSPGRTSRPLCSGCALPDDRVRCSALVHPEIAEVEEFDLIERFPRTALCDAGHQDRVRSTADCRAGGNDCWRVDLSPPVLAAAASVDAPARVIDEVKHLRLVLAGVFRSKPWRGSDELGVGATLTTPCYSAEDLEAKITAIASLLASTNVAKAADRLGAPIDDPAKSLASLEQALDWLGVDGHEPPIATLKRLQQIRSLMAHDNWDERILALRTFGIPLPIDDYEQAWLRLAGGVVDALRKLRLRVEAAVDADAASDKPTAQPPAADE